MGEVSYDVLPRWTTEVIVMMLRDMTSITKQLTTTESRDQGEAYRFKSDGERGVWGL